MLTVSPVAIANMALSNIGSKSHIESFTEKSPEANQCNIWYGFSLQQALESFDWSFARSRFQLALDGDAPPDEWNYRYQYPADCAKARRIWNPAGSQADAVPFDLETNSKGARTILCNLNSALLVYTKAITDTSAFSTFFVELVSRGLAQHIAFKLTGKREIVKDQVDTYQSMLRAAPAQDANERVGQPPRDAEWIRGRTFAPYPGQYTDQWR